VTVYYNEHDLRAAAWLRELIADGLLPEGDVDERSIADVQADELRGYVQCHFFAGIGGWPLALQRAGWPADRPVWTGSCPCQPFSGAWSRGERSIGEDGQGRLVEPGVQPLADGVSGRVALLRGAGNAIVVPQAEAFVRAYSDIAAHPLDA